MSRNPVRTVLQRTPLRVTLVVALVLMSAVGLVATGAVVTTQLRGYLIDQVDQDLAGQIPPSLQGGPQPGDEHSPFGHGRAEWLRVTDTGRGARLRRSSDRVRRAGAGHQPGPDPGRGTSPVHGGFGVGGRPVAGGRPAGQSQGGAQVLAVRAISLHDVDGTVSRLVSLEVLVGAIVLALLGVLAYVVVRTSLRPLSRSRRPPRRSRPAT